MAGCIQCNGVARDKADLFYTMGYSVRTSDWRYTAWARYNASTLLGDLSDVAALRVHKPSDLPLLVILSRHF